MKKIKRVPPADEAERAARQADFRKYPVRTAVADLLRSLHDGELDGSGCPDDLEAGDIIYGYAGDHPVLLVDTEHLVLPAELAGSLKCCVVGRLRPTMATEDLELTCSACGEACYVPLKGDDSKYGLTEETQENAVCERCACVLTSAQQLARSAVDAMEAANGLVMEEYSSGEQAPVRRAEPGPKRPDEDVFLDALRFACNLAGDIIPSVFSQRIAADGGEFVTLASAPGGVVYVLAGPVPSVEKDEAPEDGYSSDGRATPGRFGALVIAEEPIAAAGTTLAAEVTAQNLNGSCVFVVMAGAGDERDPATKLTRAFFFLLVNGKAKVFVAKVTSNSPDGFALGELLRTPAESFAKVLGISHPMSWLALGKPRNDKPTEPPMFPEYTDA